MPRSIQTKADRRLAEEIIWKFYAAANARAPREVEWDKARKRYDPAYVDKTKVKRPPYTKQGYVFRTVNNQVSHLMQATEANGRYVNAHATTPEYGAVGDVVTQAVDRQFRWKGSSVERGNEDRLERCGGSALLYGTGIIYCDWMEHPTDWGVRFTNISPWDFLADWRGQSWYVIRRWMNVSDLADMARSLSAPVETVVGMDPETGEPIVESEPRDGGRAERVFKKLLKEIKEGKRQGAAETLGGLETTHGYSKTQNEVPIDLNRVSDDTAMTGGHQSDPFNTRIEVLQYIETHEEGIIALIVPGFGNDGEDLVLRKEKNPYKVCPVVVFTPNPIGNEFWGYGAGEIIGSRAEVMDYLERAQIRLIVKNADAPLLHRRNLRLRRDFLLNPTGKAVEVDDVSTAMGYLAPGIDQGLYSFAHQFATMQADRATGESEQRRGNTGSASSATEAAIAESGGQTNDKLVFRRWKRFVEQIGRVCLEMLKVHITTEKAIPLLGRDADQLVRLKPEFLRGTFEVRFGGSLIGANTQQDIASRLNLAQTFGPTGVVDLSALARDILQKIGVVNPDEFMVQDAGRPKVNANQENLAWMEFGQEPTLHQQDNHAEHFVKHRKVFAELAAENPLDPRLPLMETHIQEHLAAAMFQQQQQMGMGGGPGGPGMQQAGGAGQPQVLNGRTANVAQMRQQPNEQAAGQSPGGVVPNRQTGQIAYGGPQR
jgi:hypothetical protein